MNNTLLITGAACAALFFIDILCAPAYIKEYLARHWRRPRHRRLKPLDCHTCLPFWICFITGYFLGKNIVDLLFMSVIASILAVLIQKAIEK